MSLYRYLIDVQYGLDIGVCIVEGCYIFGYALSELDHFNLCVVFYMR